MKAAFLPVVLAAPAWCAVFTARLQPNTITAWDKYVERAEHSVRPTLDTSDDSPVLVDLNPKGDNAGEDVPGGYIHHWIGALRIPNITVAAVRAVLENYPQYPRIYAPDVKLSSASHAGERDYDVRLVTERAERIGLHFAFDMRSRVNFRAADGDSIIESRSYLIRESESGKPPYTDLRPEGNDHGILWRLNSYWRLRQTGASVYAECEVISLSRKPLIGMGSLVKNRARDSLEATLRQTRNRAVRPPD